ISFDVTTLNDGTLTITATLTNQGSPSPPVSTTTFKDAAVPAAPTIGVPATVDSSGLTTFTVTIAGEPAATASWSIPDGLTTLSDVVALDATGHATVVTNVSTLVDGTLTTTVTLADAVGNVSAPASATTTKTTTDPGTVAVTVALTDGTGAE